jgi:hypothetical protein
MTTVGETDGLMARFHAANHRQRSLLGRVAPALSGRGRSGARMCQRHARDDRQTEPRVAVSDEGILTRLCRLRRLWLGAVSAREHDRGARRWIGGHA